MKRVSHHLLLQWRNCQTGFPRNINIHVSLLKNNLNTNLCILLTISLYFPKVFIKTGDLQLKYFFLTILERFGREFGVHSTLKLDVISDENGCTLQSKEYSGI